MSTQLATRIKIKRTRTIEETIKESEQFIQFQKKAAIKKRIIKDSPQKQVAIKKNSPQKQVAIKKNSPKKVQAIQKKVVKNNQNAKQKQIQIVTPPIQQQQIIINQNQQKQYINQENLREDIHEVDQYRNFTEKFLGIEGAFSEFKVTIASFYNDSSYTKTAYGELQRRGFQYSVSQNLQDFIKTLHQNDIAWIISSNTFLSEEDQTLLASEIQKFLKNGKSLFLWADNTPYTSHANCILEKLFDGMNLQGNYHGGKLVTKQTEKLTTQTFDGNHPIAYGLNNIHEGITICHPEKMHQDFKVFAYNSNNEPMVIYAEKNENHGRIIVDTGFTKLFSGYWENAGTHQYVSNANVWLTGVQN